MYTSVNKYSKSQPKAGTYLLRTGSKMKAVSNYVPALRTMQQDKTAANPNPLKTNQHEENCYKLDGYINRITTESIAAESSDLCASFCWQPTLITASSYWVKFPIVTAGVDPFCSTISIPMLLHCALRWFCSIASETTGSLQIGHENIRSLMLLHMIEPWKPR